jgi:cell filamentation protein
MKYQVPDNQSEILPNIQGLTLAEEIAMAEFEGFLEAEILLTEKLSPRTRFTLNYVLQIHKLALKKVYRFAGKYRDVNLSKGGFPFAAARFLPETMQVFSNEVLSRLPSHYSTKEMLIRDIAIVHGELLVIHPFREGNGRTARILANLMTRKAGYGSLSFEKIGKQEFEAYIVAVQKSAEQDYTHMIQLIEFIFPD